MASDIVRPPKGVVGYSCCMVLAFNWAKEICSPKRRLIIHEAVDCDSRKCDSRNRQMTRRGFRNSFRGPFSFAGLSPVASKGDEKVAFGDSALFFGTFLQKLGIQLVEPVSDKVPKGGHHVLIDDKDRTI